MSNDKKVPPTNKAQPGKAPWTPKPGRSIEELGKTLEQIEKIDTTAYSGITSAAIRVLEQAAPPKGDRARRTGLVVGYVQSGKTLSMTTVAALSRDNGFRIVIVFAGVTSMLLKQTRKRFADYLQPSDQYPKQWRILDYEKPALLVKKAQELKNLVATWKNSKIRDQDKPALLLTVMKHHAHLKALAQLLESTPLVGVPVLIIDDEADQAGLNTSPKKQQASSTHNHIAEVRKHLPHHTYLQYTATPQAPLLISLIDMLSPEFAEVLDPGRGYTGGVAFFETSSIVASLPGNELFKPGTPPTEPPAGLISSLQQFFVAAGAFAVERTDGKLQSSGPWSMLVHPSQRQTDHGAYLHWIQQIQKQWREDLELPDTDPDQRALVEDFRDAYESLAQSDNHLPPFDKIIAKLPSLIAAETIITELNSEHANEVPWNNAFAHVLVGGEKLNRGVTVKGLITTYMPRNAGGWNADTIQQRARFFGYKAGYLQRCRVYLHPDVRKAYRDYIDHERSVRQTLSAHRGKPLVEWKRAFFMEGRMRPTRTNVLSDPYYKIKQKPNSWHLQDNPHDLAIHKENYRIITRLLRDVLLRPYWDDGRHLSCVIPMQQLQEQLMVPFKAIGSHDIRWMLAVRLWINDILSIQPGAEARIVLMDGGRDDESRRIRERKLGKRGKIEQLAQGPDPRTGYPGDRKIFDRNRVTLQIHRLRPTVDGVKLSGVYALGVRIPGDRSDVLVQP